MLKIAHIATTYQSIVTILDSKLRALDKYGDLNLTAISSPPDSPLPADFYEVKKAAVRFIPVSMARTIKPWEDLKSIWQLYKVLKHEKFDVVHSHTSKAGFIAALAAKAAGVGLIVHTHHGMAFFEGQSKKAFHLHRFLEKLGCRFRDHAFTQNKRDLAACVRLMGSEKKVSYEGNGVDVDYVKQLAQSRRAEGIRAFPCSGTKVVLLSRLEPVKRVPDFVVAAAKLLKDGIEVACVIAGTGSLEVSLRKQITQMGLTGRVNIVGTVDYPHALIQASDIVVLCSEKEGIPRSLMEAMALQKPVVATDVVGTQELVIDNQTGFLVPVGNTDALASKIKLLSDDKELRTKMGWAGYDRVHQCFDDVKIASFLHDFYVERVRALRASRTDGR